MKTESKMSIVEFRQFCDSLTGDNIFVFDSRNQNWGEKVATIFFSLQFDNIIVSYNPNTICLSKGEKNFFGMYDNFFRFERVKYIIYKGEIAGNKYFSIICGNFNDDLHDVEYELSII